MDKKIVCTVLVFMLLLSTMHLTEMQKVEAQSTTVVYVDPPISYAALSQTFSINISIANVTNFSGYSFTLYWDNAILDCISVVETPPAVWGTNYWLLGPGLQQNYNSTHGMYHRSVSRLFPAPLFNGSTTLATLTFQVAGVGECVLALYDTKLSDPHGNPIPHEAEDGYFKYTPFEHDIAVFLEAPRHLMLGDSALLNATVLNGGLNNETDVELQLLINGGIVNSTVIGTLQVNSSYTLSYLWTPLMVETTYNVTAYALPVPNENFTLNNMDSARVLVSYVIRVPFHFSTIQEAIDAANPGDTILVSVGTYYEHLTIDKSLTLAGEESSMPVVDGSGGGYIIHVRADNVDISNFNIQNGLYGILVDSYIKYVKISGNTITNNGMGIALWFSNNTIVSRNIVSNNYGGIDLAMSHNNIIKDNRITDNTKGGITLEGTLNTVISNIVSNNGWGISVYGQHNTISDNKVSNNGIGIYAVSTENNVIYHNSFINNAEQLHLENSSDIWDNGCEGNYWSDYNGTDINGDGIGDTLLPHQGVDYYPLMSPYMEGDVNHDALVDIFDMVTIAIVYGSRIGDPNWNPHADLNEDKIIDINDIVIAAIHFGEKW